MHTDHANRAQHKHDGHSKHDGTGNQLVTAVLHVGGLHYVFGAG